ncbi:MAG: topoisomerase C-terminal repeat-containing protein [Fibrobacteria bacterium]|nr:topoisomerase C-terminal repeat-containing protein [Fibrobacteria bacterium]
MKVLIAEKPSVATGAYRELLEKVEGERFSKRDGYLEGQNYTITWCVGHLVGLSMPQDYGWTWRLDSLPMVPDRWLTYVMPRTQKQFKILADLCKKADTIIHGADAGREGELITNQALSRVGVREKKQLRLWVNSFDLPSLTKAWKGMKEASEYRPLLASAVARSRADWLVGLNGTMGYSVKTGERGLSVGRVQTPTLALIVQRDLDIENWKDRHYYQVQGDWNKLRFTWYDDSGTDIENEEAAQALRDKLDGGEGELKSISKTEKKESPGKPFDLTELQKAANKAYGIKAADTLKLTQTLYENKFVSYPRTDSQYIPETMKDEVVTIAGKVMRPEEKPLMRSSRENFIFFNSKKVTDHYAIIPTGVPPKNLGANELKIYELIRSQFVQAFMKPHIHEEYKLELVVKKESMKATVRRILDKGFKTNWKPKKEKPDDEPSNYITEPLTHKKGDIAPLENAQVVNKKATKPKHYTEATLLTAMSTAGRVIENEEMREAMKERGLGTPATKASIIERLKTVAYIEEKGKKLLSTPKGKGLIGMVDARLKSPEMTGDWEYKLNQMAKGKYESADFKAEIIKYVGDLVDSIKKNDFSSFSQTATQNNHTCPKCKKSKLFQYPKIWKCSNYDCGFILWPKMAGKKLSEKNLVELVTTGKTGPVKGFKSKKGKMFDAAIFLNERFEAKFKF